MSLPVEARAEVVSFEPHKPRHEEDHAFSSRDNMNGFALLLIGSLLPEWSGE